MATYFTDFSEYSIGSIPGDWTARWDATTQWTVETGGDDKILKGNFESSNRFAASWNDIDSDADRDDVEVLVKILTKSVAAAQSQAGIMLRGSGTSTTENGYAVRIGKATGTGIGLVKYVSSTLTTIVEVAKTLTADTWYWLRFRANGSSLQARIWADGGSEPGTWDINQTDTSITGTGWAGVFGFYTLCDPEFDTFGVGTNGDTAPDSASTTADLAGAASATATATGAVTHGVPLAGAASAAATATGSLAGGAALQADAAGVASASGAISHGVPLAGAAAASASAAAAFAVSISSPDDRGTLSLADCSYSAGTITLKSRWSGSQNTTGARALFGRVDGVNGMTPAFRLIKSNWEGSISASYKFLYSYDGINWLQFANRSSDATYYYFDHSSAFTGDTVYIAGWWPWRIGYTLPWIESLEASGYVSDTPSTTGYVFSTRSATVDELGGAIAETDMYAFKISEAGLAPDGQAKRKMVLMSGVHASEDCGNYTLKGAVEFLVSADAQAGIVRDWFDIYVYPLVSTAGRMGGSERSDFQSGFMTSDVNRKWNTTDLETINEHKTAIQADAGSVVKVFMDFHGDNFDTVPYDYVHSAMDTATWATAIQTYRAALGQTSWNTAGTSDKWFFENKAADFALTPEYMQLTVAGDLADALDYGADHMRAVADIANAGYWASTVVDLAAAAVSVATATGAMSHSVPLAGAATATASASGGLSLSVPLAVTAAAVAGSTGALSINVSLSGAAIATAAAAAGLTVDSVGSANLEANAAAAATASAALTHAVPLSGAALTVASASGGITHIVPLTGSAASASMATGGLDVSVSLAAAALASALAAATLTVQGGLAGDAAAVASASATITLRVNLDGAAIANAIAAGALTTAGLIIESAPGFSITRAPRAWRIAS